MIRSLLIVALMSWPSPAQIASPSHVWDPVFQESWTAWTHGEVERAHSLVGKGWVMVKRAGPNADGYADGVDLAYTTADYSGRTAESFYSEALKSTRSKRYNAVRLQILLRMSLRFTHQQEMRAKGLFEQAVKLSESMTPPPKTLRQTFVAFAELEDRMGEPEEAAKLRRRRDAIVGNAAREYLPLPRFGLSTDPNLISENFKQGQTFKGLVYGAERLILEGEYERGSEASITRLTLLRTFHGL